MIRREFLQLLGLSAMNPYSRVKAIMIGDSGLWGANGQGRLAVYPQMTLNANQSVFDFCYDFSKPGAAWKHVFSPSQSIRQNALPNGVTFDSLLQQTDARAILFGLGANDYDNLDAIINGVIEASRLCAYHNKVCAFVGIADGNATSAYNYDPQGATSFYESDYIQVAGKLAQAAEVLRQVCTHEGYVYIDIRNCVPIIDSWGTITGDVVHASQSYSTAIYTHVANWISS